MIDDEKRFPAGWRPTHGEMAGLVGEMDWAGTALGARDAWSPSLKLAVDIVLASPFPMALRWGGEFTLIYNDGYKPILGGKHPWALGRPAREAWSEVWSEIEPAHLAIMNGGGAIFADDILLRIRRHRDIWEDAHFTLSYSPVRDLTAPSGVGGILVTAIEITERLRTEAALRVEIGQRVEAEAELQRLNATLEQRVAAEVAERAKAEDALRQAQKMEAVGQLTGGVAHDFNNLLTVILGGLDTVLRSREGDHARIRRAAEMALQGAQRAASLTARLLAFSRRQPLQPRPCDLNALVRDMTELLHRTLGETIELEGVLSPRLWPVEVDANQLESAILNLAVNARDALPDGGKLTIETANVSLDETYVAIDAEVVAGQYVVISVSDNGAGMTPETLARVFEPFFTTKEVGKGTGLGLSMVYGFVKQSGGHVTVYSEEGQGTTIKLYLPRHLGEGAVVAPRTAPPPPGHGDEVILVVEDNEDVRAYSASILRELGYGVLEAADADGALAILAGDQPIDLLFTDVVLPGRSGRVLADAAAALRPDLPVLFTTGYSRNAIVHHGRLDAGVQLIGKPFTFDQLALRVRDTLEAAKRSNQTGG